VVKAKTGSSDSVADGALASRGDGAASGRLAERYRPTRFSDVVGQETAVKSLIGIVREQDRVPGAILLAGPFGTGKTTLAGLLAAGLNCKDPKDGEPCLDCASCRPFRNGTPLGVLPRNAGADGGVDVVRRLVENLQTYGWTRWRIVFLDEAHAFSKPAYEALLGPLESPPPNTIFVLATTEPGNLPETVRSRLLLVPLRRVSASAIRTRLKEVVAREGIQVSGDVLGEIARVSSGSLRDALNALERAAMMGVRDLAGLRRVRQEDGRDRLERDGQFDSLMAVTAKEFCSDVEAERPRELLGPLVLAGDRIVLGADTGQGKTTFALQLVRAIVVGEDCLGWRGIGGSRALFIDAEQGRWALRRRLEELGLDGHEDVDIVHAPGGLTLDKNGIQQGELEQLIAEGKYDVVVAILCTTYTAATRTPSDQRLT
jgi:DNA polymerase III delta prime subunit